MNLTAYEIALIGVGGTIIGSLAGAWIGYRLSISLVEIQAKRNAGLKLREAFKDEIIALNPSQYALKEALPDFLNNAFYKHRSAIFDFAFLLPKKSEIAFYNAWHKYYCHKDLRNENSIPFFEQYSLRGKNIEEQHAIKQLVKKRIESILEFTTCK